jgi:hypothetical protein
VRSQDEVTAILDRLLTVERSDEPTIAKIEAKLPDLRRLDWINRFGPADAWMQIAADLGTDELEWLIKILVVAEREYDWLGGSVAAPIWLFRAYSERADTDADALADWALRNRGRNDYIPFGRMTAARSLEQWRREQDLRAAHRELQRYRVQEQKEAKAQRAKDAAERSFLRTVASRARHEELLRHLDELRGRNARDRLLYIAAATDLPLEFIPHDLIVECTSAAQSLDRAYREVLLKRIDRRSRTIWRRLRSALDA